MTAIITVILVFAWLYCLHLLATLFQNIIKHWKQDKEN